MTPRHLKNKSDTKALLIGGLLVFLVGAYFIGKTLFFSDKKEEISSAPVLVDTKEGVPLIAANVLLKKIQAGESVTLLDVRDETAFQGGHIAHSLSLPISSLGNYSAGKDETVVIVYGGADRAVFEAAKNVMSQKSFAYVFLQDGFEGWKALSAPIISNGDQNSFIDQSKVTYMSVEEYKKIEDQKSPPLFLLDVQSADNFQKKHLKNATNIPLALLEKRVSEIPGGRLVIVYGENSLQSFQGGVRLSDIGLFSVQTLQGDKHLTSESGLLTQP